MAAVTRRRELILALDLGTSGVKVLAMTPAGEVGAEATVDYPLYSERSGMAEQDPADWWQATIDGCRLIFEQGVHPHELIAVSLSGQMQNCLLLDREGRALGRAILYADGRGAEQAAAVLAQMGRESFWQRTRNPLDASATLAKLLWLREHQPDRYKAATHVLPGAKDWVLYQLTGCLATDPTNASTTGMMHLASSRWDDDLLQQVRIARELLPEIVEAYEEVGKVTPQAAQLTGLPVGLPVFCGAGDAGSSTVGAGAISVERAYCYLGTTGWVATVASQPSDEEREWMFNLRHPDPGLYISVGPLLNAGRAYEWARECLADMVDRGNRAGSREAESHEAEAYDGAGAYALMEERVKQAEPGSGGVIFLPYLAGERSPFRDLQARGVFFGLTTRTGRNELLRSVQEGVAYAIRHVMDATGDLRQVERMVFIGGGSRSATWSQILADVTGCHIAVPRGAVGGPALGAAMSALVGLGISPDYRGVDDLLKIEASFEPDQKRSALYEQLYELYRSLYPALQPAYRTLAHIEGSECAVAATST